MSSAAPALLEAFRSTTGAVSGVFSDRRDSFGRSLRGMLRALLTDPLRNRVARVHCVLPRRGRLGRGARRRGAGLLLERDRLELAGVFSAAASLTTSEPVLRFPLGFGSDFVPVSAKAGAVGATFAFALTL
jgi:hypothetical protein